MGKSSWEHFQAFPRQDILVTFMGHCFITKSFQTASSFILGAWSPHQPAI